MQGSTRSYEMGRRLVERGHSVVMLTSWRDVHPDRDWFITDEGGIEVHWLPVLYRNEMTYSERIRAFFRFAFSAARRAASLDGDVVFATSTPLTIALPGAWAARRRRRPMVFEVRDLWPQMPIAIGALRNPLAIWAARRLEHFAYRNAARIVALSPGMAEGVAEAGFAPDRIRVIPNSCDLDLFQPDSGLGQLFRDSYPKLGNGPIVLYAGTIGRINGVEYMVDLAGACARLAPAANFVVLGAGSESDRVRQRAIELGVLNKNFHILPQLPKKDVVVAFAAASVVCSWVVDIPGTEKNSANKFFDGLAAGRAIAINHGGWQADILNESGAGLVLSRKVDEAAQQLSAWLNDPERLASAGHRARALGESRFSRDRLAGELEAVLKEAANG